MDLALCILEHKFQTILTEQMLVPELLTFPTLTMFFANTNPCLHPWAGDPIVPLANTCKCLLCSQLKWSPRVLVLKPGVLPVGCFLSLIMKQLPASGNFYTSPSLLSPRSSNLFSMLVLTAADGLKVDCEQPGRAQCLF